MDLSTMRPRQRDIFLSKLCTKSCLNFTFSSPKGVADNYKKSLANFDCLKTDILKKSISIKYISCDDLERIDFCLSTKANPEEIFSILDGRFNIKNYEFLPLKSILKSVRTHYNAFALLENPYIDMEYIYGHAGFYDFEFNARPITCRRLHFLRTF